MDAFGALILSRPRPLAACGPTRRNPGRNAGQNVGRQPDGHRPGARRRERCDTPGAADRLAIARRDAPMTNRHIRSKTAQAPRPAAGGTALVAACQGANEPCRRESGCQDHGGGNAGAAYRGLRHGAPVHSRLEAVAIMSDNAGRNKHIAVQHEIGAGDTALCWRDKAVNPDRRRR